jgi:hypothetical protein
MICVQDAINPHTESDLLRMIEPLAGYICAADRPRAALASALSVLLQEVEQTNRAASQYVTQVSEAHQP